MSTSQVAYTNDQVVLAGSRREGQPTAENLWPWFTSSLFVIFAMQIGGWTIWKILFIVQKQT